MTISLGIVGSIWDVPTNGEHTQTLEQMIHDVTTILKLVFEFDTNGIYGKQVHIMTTSFDINGINSSFGWYKDDIKISMITMLHWDL